MSSGMGAVGAAGAVYTREILRQEGASSALARVVELAQVSYRP